MKKKKQNSSTQLSEIDLKSLIHQHNEFFDNLVELIPARFYLPVDDNEKPWFQGLSKVDKELTKKKTRENIKDARRNRFNPENVSTTLDQLKKNIDREKKKAKEDKSDEDEVKFDNKATYEELREKLHKKIEELRLKRNAGDMDKPKNERNERRREIREGKRKRNAEDKDKDEDHKANAKKKEEDEKKAKIDEEVTKATERLTFSNVKIGDEDEVGRKKKKKKLSKTQALEEAKKLVEVKKDPEQGKKLSWQAATSRAAGVKVHDDPKLIKESIKKGKRKHEKNVAKWKERIESRDKVRTEKQQKRSGNIAERIQDKKNRRIAKREKKLMRPGFEGRKEGFITKS